VHPSFTGRTFSFSYGFYDCFGFKLENFDDCGGLPFQYVNSEGKIKRSILTETKIKNGMTQKNYWCWKSGWFPDYECGVPKGLTKEVCKAWNEYKARLQ
jgi:hypothetical protein